VTALQVTEAETMGYEDVFERVQSARKCSKGDSDTDMDRKCDAKLQRRHQGKFEHIAAVLKAALGKDAGVANVTQPT
jgi:hypothetical protein